VAILGWPELVLVLGILLLVFGGSKIKDLAKGLGESIREFKKASSSEASKKDEEEERETIAKAAQKMGINTEGKSLKQILGEMKQAS